jgi:signal transduction histidine kinase/CheY-like chemotaxis protein
MTEADTTEAHCDKASSRTDAALGYLQQLLEQATPEPVDSVFVKLAELFDAAGGGLSSLPGALPALRYQAWRDNRAARPVRLPWDENASAWLPIRGAIRASALQFEGGTWLVCQVWEPRGGEALLFWMWREGKKEWLTSEAAALTLAGQTVARLAFRAKAGSVHAWQVACTRRQLEQAALLTSRLSHDFGNFLTGIMGFTELSLAQLPANTPAARYLQEVLDAARQGAKWIHKLHEFCRRNLPEHWPAPLPALVSELTAGLEEATVAGLVFKTDVPAHLPLLALDADAVRTILTQLVENAREALKGKGTIALKARPVELTQADCDELLGGARPGPYVEVTIADTGPGMSPEVRARLFNEIFYSSKPRYRGLGYLMVYGILQRFGGGLRLEPATAEGGTTVRVYLPAVGLPAALPGDVLQGASVLVVLDDAVMRESLCTLLSAAGCKTTPAAGAHQALALYQTSRTPFALVLAEVRLANLSGFELARRIQDRAESANFLFVQMQAYSSPSRDERLKTFDILCRPFDVPALLGAVRAALGRHGAASAPTSVSP